jgi:TRAP-type transport system periplasmic protein
VQAPVRAARFSWKYGSANAADHPANVAIVEALAKIREETRGELDIKPFLNSSLGSDSALVSQLRIGALETLIEGAGPFDTIVGIASIEEVAFAFSDYRTPLAAMDGDLGKMIRDALPAAGFIALERVFDNGFRYFTSSVKPIRKAEDLEGLKLRVSPGKLFYDTFHSLGVSSVSLGLNEIYLALQTHLVDAQETPLITIENQRFYEVQRYCSLSRHIWSCYFFLINRDKWQSLPSAYQDILRKHINAAALTQRRATAVSEAAIRDKLQRQGLIFNPIDRASFKSKLVASGYYGRWREAYGPGAWALLEKYAGPLG